MLRSFRFFSRMNILALTSALALGAAACGSTVEVGGPDADPDAAGQAIQGKGKGQGQKHKAIALLASQLFPDQGSSSVGSSGTGISVGSGGEGGWSSTSIATGVGGAGGAGGFPTSSVSTSVTGGGGEGGVSTTTSVTGVGGAGGFPTTSVSVSVSVTGVGGGGEGGYATTTSVSTGSWGAGGSDGSGGSSSTGVGGSGGIDPNTLFLRITDDGLTCGQPSPSFGCGHWSVSIALPPELQKVGVIPLDTPGLNAVFFANDEEDEYGTCGGGGGSYLEGTLEIKSINAQHVVFELDDTYTFLGLTADGHYVAPRCQ